MRPTSPHRTRVTIECPGGPSEPGRQPDNEHAARSVGRAPWRNTDGSEVGGKNMAASQRWASFIATCATCATSFESSCLISRSGPHAVPMCCRCGEQVCANVCTSCAHTRGDSLVYMCVLEEPCSVCTSMPLSSHTRARSTLPTLRQRRHTKVPRIIA